MSHYICTGGCKGVSEHPGACQANACPRHSLGLKECTCTDHKHWGAFDSRKPTASQELSVLGLSVSLAIIFGVLVFLNELVTLFLTPDANPELNFTTLIISAVVAAIGGFIVGAVTAWLYNKFRR